jgi:hypothetical protein
VGSQIDCTGDLGIDGSHEQWSCVLATLSCGPDARATLGTLAAPRGDQFRSRAECDADETVSAE